MSWSKYAEFLAFAVVLVLIPGPDFAVVTKNTLVGGRRRGRWTALGVSSSNLVQGTAAAFGLSAAPGACWCAGRSAAASTPPPAPSSSASAPSSPPTRPLDPLCPWPVAKAGTRPVRR
jgi:threonine/homoserine/homoserine lactone efflux protein